MSSKTTDAQLLDRNVDRVYDHVNTFWRRAYGQTSSTAEETIKERAALEDVYLVSIGGGISDITIASESALVPINNSNGFSVFTTAIPGVNTPGITNTRGDACFAIRHVENAF
ncbi:hypothetical protein T439DRAFT_351581 [Meredithblackwellia eburnea MCA 4105]